MKPLKRSRINDIFKMTSLILYLVAFLYMIPTQSGTIGEDLPKVSLLVSSDLSNNVLIYDGQSGITFGIFASGNGLDRPRGMTFGPDGNLYVASAENSRIYRFHGKTGSFIDVFVQTGGGGLERPIHPVFGLDGNLLVSDPSNDVVRRYTGQSGFFMDNFITSGSSGLDAPNTFLIHTDGLLYLLSSDTGDKVLRYNATTGDFDRTFVPSKSGGLNDPQDLVFGPDGNLYVSSGETDEVLRYNGLTGAFIDAFVPAGSGGLNYPKGLAFGPDGNLYVASYLNDRVLRYDGQSGEFVDEFIASGSGGLNGPIDLEFVLENHPPSQPTVEIFSKRNPNYSHDFLALASNSVDPDSDPVQFSYEWLMDGMEIDMEPGVPVSGPVVRELFASDGRIIECIVTPSDGVVTGATGSASTKIIVEELFPDGVINAKDLLILLNHWHEEID